MTVALNRRLGTADDAVAGVVPAEVVRPSGVEEVAEVLRQTQREGHTVLATGGRTKTGWAPPPSSADVLIDTTGLDLVVEHTAGDLVVVAEAGLRLSALQQRLRAAGQWLALDPPEQGATLGGVVSANASGPRRLRYGTVRDLLIGVTVVLADGTVAHAGGKVVKNVAGYDLGKLYTGAHGSLGVVVSTTWRLHPLPAARRVVVLDLSDPLDAGPFALAMARSTLTPSAVEVHATTGGSALLVVVFEAILESVRAQADATVALLRGGRQGDDLPDGFGERPGSDSDLVLRLAFAPASLPDVLQALPDGTVMTSSACTGVAYAALAAEHAGLLPTLRTALAPHDGTAVVLHAPADLRDGLDHWGSVGDALDLMRRVKDRFDPNGSLAPGRFVGGI
ncbi:MAG: FAD-binding oxidoreductase [Propionibacteriales bacterium]|nr:FAD-binding oxidoreductase [Propionibacteriales bacterium]